MVFAPLGANAQDALLISNEAVTGTTLNKLAKITGAPSTAIISATTDTDNILGIVTAGAGTTNSAVVAVLGSPNCVFDATSVVAGDYVTNSASVAGACHDAGATRPTGSQVIGRALASGGGGSTIAVSMDKGFANTAGSTSFANPSATASDTAVNGGAGTAMRSDAAPAVQKGTNAQFGLVKGDGSTITCVAGLCSSLTGGAGTVTNPSNLTTNGPIVGGPNGTTDVKSTAAMTDGQDLIGQTGAAPLPKTMSGDCTRAASGAIACTKINGDSNVAFLDVNQAWTKGQAVTPTVGGAQAAGGTLTPDFSLSNAITATFGAGNLTIANPTNVKVGQSYVIALTQDGVGSRTVTWGANYKWASATAPTLSTAASAKDVISCWADTTTTINCTLAVKGAS